MRLRVVGIVACLALVASGVVWGSSAGAQPTQKQEPITVKIGQILPIDSVVVPLKETAIATEAGVAGFNKRNKHIQFELVQCDSRGDANQEAACARELIDDGVVATIGDAASFNPATVNELFVAAGIPRVAFSVFGATEFTSPISYPLFAGPTLPMAAVAEAVAKKGIKKVSVVRIDIPATAQIPALVKPQVAKQGMEVVAEVAVPATATDYSQSVAAASANGAEAALVVAAPVQLVPLLKSASQLGNDILWATSTYLQSTADVINMDNENLLQIQPFVYPSKGSAKAYPGINVFLKDMKKAKKPELAPELLTGSMLQSWLGLQALTELTKDMDTVDAASLKQALDTTEDIDMLGITPPWTPSTQFPVPNFARVSNPYLFNQTFTGKEIVTKKQTPIDLAALFSS